MRPLERIAAAVIVATLSAATYAADPESAWAYSISLYGYDVPESQDYLNPNVTADHGHLHLEVRYQYEGLDTTSLWAGANFHTGEAWSFDATMMLGLVMGDLDGVAPRYRLSLSHTWFTLASEGEYFASTKSQDDNFLYSWTEASGSPTDWFRAGIAAQRTRAYQSDLSIQRGLFVGFTYKSFDAAAYVFNLGWEDPTYVLALRWDF
jgi:hypothetical protein